MSLPKKRVEIYFKSIHKAILVSFITLIVLVVSLFVGISLLFTEETVLENSKEYTMQLIEQVNAEVDSYIDYMENISRMYLYNHEVRDYLIADYKSEEEKKQASQRIIEQYGAILEVRNDIYCMAIIGTNGRMIINKGHDKVNPNLDVKTSSWYKEAVAANGQIVISSSHVQNLIKDKYRWVISLSRAVIDPATKEVIGVLLVDLNYNIIENLGNRIDLGNKGYIFVLDQYGKLIYHPKQQLIYSGLKVEKTREVMECTENYFLTDQDNDKGKLYTISRSEKTGWTVVGVANVSELFKNEDKAKKIYLLSALVLFMIAILISLFISGQLTRPIKLLKNSMREVENGNFEPVSPVIINDSEIGKLGRAFNIMVEKIRTLMEEQIRDQKLKRKSELKALQAQINPHFLYNTLDSIVWMAEGKKNEEVVIMTASLARLLRQSISNEAEFVTIGQEISYVKSYLTIQKMRYQDQLNFTIDIDVNIQQIKVIKMILQPLVENAIYHGVKYKGDKGEISIKGFERDDTIIIQIIDDGIGMNPEDLANIFHKKESKGKSNGVGVCNVNDRIKLHYGKEYGLYYESQLGIGTMVSVILPKISEEDET